MLIQAMWIEAEDYRQRRRFSLFIWGGRLVGACDEQEYANTKGSAKSGQLLGLKMLDEGETGWKPCWRVPLDPMVACRCEWR
jgi:hypothetical protein